LELPFNLESSLGCWGLVLFSSTSGVSVTGGPFGYVTVLFRLVVWDSCSAKRACPCRLGMILGWGRNWWVFHRLSWWTSRMIYLGDDPGPGVES
jgi:hypothetical protein